MCGSVLAKKSSWRVLPSWGDCGVATSKVNLVYEHFCCAAIFQAL